VARLQPLKITYSPGWSCDLVSKCCQQINTATAALWVRGRNTKGSGKENPERKPRGEGPLKVWRS